MDRNSTNFSLIDRVRADDSKAWHELVDLYGPLVAHWCRRMSVPERSVSDCVQNVFLAVLRSLPTFDPVSSESGSESMPTSANETATNGVASTSRRGFRAWLWGITRHKCIDLMRSDARHPNPTGGSTAFHQTANWESDEGTEDWEQYTEADEITRLLRRAMMQVESEFEQKTWNAFWRTTVDGLTTAMVAQELEIEVATVRQYRSRVLRRLRRQLGEFE